ncbi:MAG: deoxynucleoside kinase [Candidatus Beckwithbacteria bacterium]
MTESQANVIVVIGNIGSGKSTVAPVVAKSLKAKMIDADNLFQTTNPFRDRYLKSNRRWALANELWMTLERVSVLECYSQYKKKKLVIDSGLLMSWAYTYSHYQSGVLSHDEWGVYQRLFDKVIGDCFKDLAVVKLNCKVDTLLRRIKKRGRKFELEYYTKAYLQRIDKGLEELHQKLQKNGLRVVEIDEKEVRGFLNQKRIKQQVIEKIVTGLS